MFVCFFIAAMVSILSTFCFFGPAISVSYSTTVPNMFTLMFGGYARNHNYVYKISSSSTLMTLFVFQMILMVLAVSYVIVWKMVKNQKCNRIVGFVLSGISIVFSFVTMIISFNTANISNLAKVYGNVNLGAGPISYSILQIISIIFSAIGIFLAIKQKGYFAYQIKTKTSSRHHLHLHKFHHRHHSFNGFFARQAARLENEVYRKSVVRVLYLVFIILLFIVLVIAPPIVFIVIAVVSHEHLLLLGLLGEPIFILFYWISVNLMLVTFGETTDLANIALNAKKMANATKKQEEVSLSQVSSNSNEIKAEEPTTLNNPSQTADTSDWECSECGYKNSGSSIECENCFTPRK